LNTKESKGGGDLQNVFERNEIIGVYTPGRKQAESADSQVRQRQNDEQGQTDSLERNPIWLHVIESIPK
jgi:hypothetical protein